MIRSLFTDLKPLNESIRKLKAIELRNPLVETVMSALSGQVEELRLTVDEVCYPLQCLCMHIIIRAYKKHFKMVKGYQIGTEPCM